jgi:hypothetical protein
VSVTDWVLLAIVIAGVAAAAFGLDRYRGNRKTASDSAAQPTDEVFIDPDTGRTTRVWYDERSGTREYRPE